MKSNCKNRFLDSAVFVFALLSLLAYGQNGTNSTGQPVLSPPPAGLSPATQQATSTSNSFVQPATKVPDVPATFKHPGLLNSMEELQFIKQKIQAGEEPWKSAFEQMKETKYASLTYKPHPHETASS